MINYKEVKAVWTSGASVPEGLHLNTIYSIIKQGDKLCVFDGNLIFPFDHFCITTFMSPTNENIKWSDVDFEEFNESKPKQSNTIPENKNFKFNKK